MPKVSRLPGYGDAAPSSSIGPINLSLVTQLPSPRALAGLSQRVWRAETAGTQRPPFRTVLSERGSPRANGGICLITHCLFETPAGVTP